MFNRKYSFQITKNLIIQALFCITLITPLIASAVSDANIVLHRAPFTPKIPKFTYKGIWGSVDFRLSKGTFAFLIKNTSDNSISIEPQDVIVQTNHTQISPPCLVDSKSLFGGMVFNTCGGAYIEPHTEKLFEAMRFGTVRKKGCSHGTCYAKGSYGLGWELYKVNGPVQSIKMKLHLKSDSDSQKQKPTIASPVIGEGTTGRPKPHDSRQYSATKKETSPLPPITSLEARSALIKTTIYAAAQQAGIPDIMTKTFANLFSMDVTNDIDEFHGSHFNLIYEVCRKNGRLIRTGNLLAAEFIHEGIHYQTIWFKTYAGSMGWYDTEGVRVQKSSNDNLAEKLTGKDLVHFKEHLKKMQSYFNQLNNYTARTQ